MRLGHEVNRQRTKTAIRVRLNESGSYLGGQLLLLLAVPKHTIFGGQLVIVQVYKKKVSGHVVSEMFWSDICSALAIKELEALTAKMKRKPCEKPCS